MAADFSSLLGKSPTLIGLREQLQQLMRRYATARRLPPVLLLGETGTGKSLIARTLYTEGPRAGRPFVDIACPAIPETLMESQIFGVERGAFTDARESKPGLFTAADRGTIFLDEVGSLSDAAQAKLLKVVEEQQIRPLGATASKPVDVWIIAATSEDLETAIRKRRFREDLYFRLAVVTLVVPPLRERGDDVVILAEHLLARACADYGLAAKTFAPEALMVLRARQWPGNIRELGNVIERVALRSETSVVTAHELGFAAANGRSVVAPEVRGRAGTRGGIDDAVAATERNCLTDAMVAAGGNVTRAARSLGLTRNAFRYRWRKYQLEAVASAPLSGAPPSSPATAGRWERRRVAFMRVGVAAAGEDVEHKQRVLLQEVLHKVEVFGGIVDGVSPHGVTAVFGLDFLEDASRRAAYAAMAIRKLGARARELDAAIPPMTLAIHAAPTLLWKVSDGVHLDEEARPGIWQALDGLVARGEPESIVVSEPAVASLAPSLHLVPTGDEDGACLLVDGERVVAPRRAGTVFVGRRDEMGLLTGRLELALEGRGQVVAIDGEPGIGKSRVLFEFSRLLDSRAAYLVARSVSYGRDLPLLPIIEVVRNAHGIEEGDSPGRIATKIRSRLTTLGMPADEMAPYLLRLIGIAEGTDGLAPHGPEMLHRRTLEIFGGVILASSRRQPLILAVEDLHWMDRASESYLAALVDVLVDASVLLVTTSRPSYRPPWGDRSNVTTLKLQPLARADARRVLDAAAVGEARHAQLPAATAEAILDRADGNPFFIEELARAMRMERAVGAAVPESIEAVLLARIDRLTDEPKRVLQAASVLGRDVPTRVLEAITGDIPTSREHLRDLQRLEYLHDRSDGAGELYRFKHALTQEVAYASLLPEDRRTLHAHVVSTLETQHARHLDGHMETLGHHAMRGQLWEKAALYLRQTGVKAFDRFALHEADACFEQALEALTQLPADRTAVDAIDVRIRLCSVLAPGGEYRRALDHAFKAAELAEANGERRQLGTALSHQCMILRIIGETDAGFDAGRRALAIAAELGDAFTAGHANYGLGIAYHTRGRFRQAAACYRESILHGEAVHRSGKPFPRYVTGSLAWLTWTLECLGEFNEGLAVGHRAIETAEAHGDRLLGVAAYLYLAVVHLGRGDSAQAIPLLERALTQCRSYREGDLLAPVVMRLGLAYAKIGRLAEGIALGEEGVAHFDIVRGLTGFPTRLAGLAETYLLAGRRADAEVTARHGVALAREHRQQGGEAVCLRALGMIAAAGAPPDVAAAETYLMQARDLAAELEMRPVVAHCHFDLAKLYAAAAERARAIEHLAMATEIYRTLDMPGWFEAAKVEAEKLGLPFV